MNRHHYAVVVGISPRGMEVALPALDLLSQKGIKGSYYGSGNPAAEIPRLARPLNRCLLILSSPEKS